MGTWKKQITYACSGCGDRDDIKKGTLREIADIVEGTKTVTNMGLGSQPTLCGLLKDRETPLASESLNAIEAGLGLNFGE